MGNTVKNQDIPEYSLSWADIKTDDSTSWKIWDLDKTVEPEKKVDSRRVTQLQDKKYKERRITNKLKVTNYLKLTSKVIDYKATKYLQASFDNLETFVMRKNDDCLEMRSMIK